LRASFYAAPAARLSGTPLVWQVHDILPSGPYVRWMARRASAAIAVSKAAMAPLPEALNVCVIPNGVDLDGYGDRGASRRRLRAEWGWPEDACVVGIVGRLRPWKGQDHFLRAMARVGQHYRRTRFAVVGGTPLGTDSAYREHLAALSAELELVDRVTFTGHRGDISEIMEALDILVQCSLEPEPFGRVIIEGMAARLPVVAYDHGGPSEIVIDGVTGRLVSPGDIDALSSAVSDLVGDRATRERMGRAGRERVEKEYDVRRLTRETERILEGAARGMRKG